MASVDFPLPETPITIMRSVLALGLETVLYRVIKAGQIVVLVLIGYMSANDSAIICLVLVCKPKPELVVSLDSMASLLGDKNNESS